MKISELNFDGVNNFISLEGIISERKNEFIKKEGNIQENLIIQLKDELTKDKIKIEILKDIVDAKIVKKGNVVEVEGIYLEDKTLKNGEVKFKIQANSISLIKELNEEDTTLKHKEFKAPKRKKAEMVKDFLQNLINDEAIEEKELKIKIHSKLDITISESEMEDIFELLNRENIFIRPKRGYIKIL